MKGCDEIMRLFAESDIFEYLDKGNVLQNKIHRILAGKSGSLILNPKLEGDIKSMVKVYKDPTTLKAANAVRSGEIILAKIPIELNLPECLPYIKHRKNGKERIIINVSNYVIENKDRDTGEVDYTIDVKKLYSLVIPGFLYLKSMHAKYTPSPEAIKISATIWARMFNKVLIRTIGLTTNQERYEAFMYFGMRFFMKYYLDIPDALVRDISEGYLSNGKGYLIDYMETKIKDLNLDPYESFTSFCSTLFNNEVSNMKGIRINNVEENINVSFYLKKFIDMYNMSAVMALSSYPFFIFTIFSAFHWSNICNDRALEDVVYNDKREMPKLMAALYKDL